MRARFGVIGQNPQRRPRQDDRVIAGRYYGSASSTPALVFPRLCKLARIHLDKINNKAWAYSLDRELTSLVSRFSVRATWPRTLSLEDQGRFAIGFYYERSPKGNEPAVSADEANNESSL